MKRFTRLSVRCTRWPVPFESAHGLVIGVTCAVASTVDGVEAGVVGGGGGGGVGLTGKFGLIVELNFVAGDAVVADDRWTDGSSAGYLDESIVFF